MNQKNECYNLKNNIKYDEIIYATRKKVIDLTWIDEPFTYPEFAKLTKYSECYKKDAVSIIKLNNSDKTLKGVVLLSMQGLGYEDTILFSDDIFNFIDEENLLLWLYGAYGNKNFIKYYKDIKYKQFINECITKFPNIKEELIYLRDGNMKDKFE